MPNSAYNFVFSDNIRSKSGGIFNELRILFTTKNATINLIKATDGNINFLKNSIIQNVPLSPKIELEFNKPIDPQSVTSNSIRIINNGTYVNLNFTLKNSNKTIVITSDKKLTHLSKYLLFIKNSLSGQFGEEFSEFSKTFYSEIDTTPKFKIISDEQLLTLIQKQTFKYFWDFAHPTSGMTRERYNSQDIVTTGGSGFGVMALIVGIERGFITREQGLQRLSKILTFLENADRFHGVWSHWLNGNSGKVYPFSLKDDGADLVETSFLVQGLLTFRQYLNSSVSQENELIARINSLWNTIEWNFFTQNENVLYWHWSPKYNFEMNMPIRGHNEALITYILAASSSNYGIEPAVYHQGYAINGNIQNGNNYCDIFLPLGQAYGGPLFFTHYSFLGLDPRNLNDNYANYWQQNKNHTLINRAYCLKNPKNYIDYSVDCWGLTASDNQKGYSAHSPTNDLGVITPSAAISSIVYTSEESLKAIHHFYYILGDRLWGEYGFYDAFNATENWWADSYLAIDQGPIIIMIENYRSGLLWDLFMSCPEIQSGLNKLEFIY
ncbi:MAG: Ig-like domain-containing protein [Bacteroidetes bacterium]|nr:Ig-like domain-containing protein [Bacteroidota bacterium]